MLRNVPGVEFKSICVSYVYLLEHLIRRGRVCRRVCAINLSYDEHVSKIIRFERVPFHRVPRPINFKTRASIRPDRVHTRVSLRNARSSDTEIETKMFLILAAPTRAHVRREQSVKKHSCCFSLLLALLWPLLLLLLLIVLHTRRGKETVTVRERSGIRTRGVV